MLVAIGESCEYRPACQIDNSGAATHILLGIKVRADKYNFAALASYSLRRPLILVGCVDACVMKD